MFLYLKRLEIQGFKSFADKTVIEFEKGITGIVGPNGSGKSNISDSVRWVLGEQSVKTLRGSKMEDVIFAGTDKRRPLGFAEVTLVLDNKDRKLPIDYSEVSITRRMFRSGESEYYINKTSCRLKDIRELFMDTGVGKDGYSIIGQGRIDEILSSKSEDRRNLFEEAAGIVKYKSRKEEAEKKLEKTKENLVRINDIISELDTQIEPLKEQSERAKKYLDLKNNLKNVEVNLYVRELEKLKEQILLLEQQKGLIYKQLEFNEQKRDSLEGKYNKVKNEIEKMDNSIEEIQNLKYDTQNSIEKIDGDIKLNNEKINMLEKELSRLSDEIKGIEERILQINSDIDNEESHKKELLTVIASLNKDLSEKNSYFQKISKEIADKERDIEEKKGDVIELFNEMADKKSKINSIKTFHHNIQKRLNQIQDEINELNNLKKENENKLEETSNQISTISSKLNQLSNKKENRIKEKALKEDEYSTKVNQLNELKEVIQGKISKCNLLKDMKNEYEGFYKSVKNTLLAVKNNRTLGRGVRGAVAELIKVNKEYEKAIEVALGSSLQNIVTESEEDAKRIINYLKEKKLGRVTFLPMTSVRGKTLNSNEMKMTLQDGCLGVASQLIEFDKKYTGIINYLLGRVVIVDNIDNGIKLAKKSNYSFKIVSLDGDVLNPGGSITGGSHNTNYTNILGRERQISETENEVKTLKEKQNQLEDYIRTLKKELYDLNTEISSLENEINDIRIKMTTLQNERKQQEEESEKINNSIIKYEKEKRQLENEYTDSKKGMESIEIELNELRNKSESTQGNIEDMIKEFDEEKTKKDDLQKEITDIRIKMASYEQELKSIEESVKKLQNDKKRIISDIELKNKKQNENTIEIDKLKNIVNNLKEEKKKLTAVLMEQDIKLKELKSDKNDYLQAFYSEQEKLNEMNRKINDLQKSMNTLEVKYTRYNSQLENINNKLWDEYELSYKMALNYKNDNENMTTLQNMAKGLKTQIKSLGNVNLGAIDEYERIKERYEFLAEQKEDLTSAKQSLNKVIEEMEDTMRKQFITNFHIIRENFQEVFVKLFNGGKADIYLENEEDALTSGIEIIAQPPGKKLQRLSLLSGGEKALTAIALLFAILKTKPTPFCILDEIEAALDDANVYRFGDYLREYSEETQFIVITHRKGTMESVDALYGVTMEEEGVTRLVSVKLSEKLSEKAS